MSDASGARGSNTGDDFHEFWAMRQALRLIERGSQLSAMALEGLTPDVKAGSDWDGVDCTLLYGSEVATTASEVELQQLKYSSASPNTPWTIARISAAKTKKRTSSVIGKMAAAYSGLISERPGRDPKTVTLQLITNQPIDTALVSALEAAKNLSASDQLSADLQTLLEASGMTRSSFCQFAQSLVLIGAADSRFLIERKVLRHISDWHDVEFVEIASELRRYVHDLMLPESSREFVTPHDILLKLGAGDPSVLFPAPSYIDPVDQPVKRNSVSEAAKLIKDTHHQHFCLHGNGGLGKTTALQLITAELPEQSVMIVYDCYGAGSYLDASKSRHRQRDAFVQIANEMADILQLPTYLVPRSQTDFPRALRRRLEEAAKLLLSLNDRALLVIAADAIDNSATAARSRQPTDLSFAHDLMSLVDLPRNVRILVSCRTSRLPELKIPNRFRKIELEPFSRSETAEHVRRYWDANDDWVDEFHELSKGIPRVQTYALKSAIADPTQAIGALRPEGKALDQIFQAQIDEAFRKHGDELDIRRFCAAVTTLPRPVPLDVLSAVSKVSRSAIMDIVADLAPGFTIDEDRIGFADEDFEAYAREAGAERSHETTCSAADYFLDTALTNAYAALAVVPMMFSAGKYDALLEFVEQNPEPPIGLLPDVAQRREIGSQRLRTAIGVCRNAGNNGRALRFVMMGAEAVHSEHNLRQFLVEHRSLSVRFAEESLRRLVLRDPENIESHGPVLLHLIGHRTGPENRVFVHEIRKRFKAWLRLREETYQNALAQSEHAHEWPIDADDFAQVLYSDLRTTSIAAAVNKYRSIRHWQFGMAAGLKVIDRLIAEGCIDAVREIAELLPLHRAAFVLVPLAMSGASIDLEKLEASVRSLCAIAKLKVQLLAGYGPHQKTGARVIDTILSGIELLVIRGRKPPEIKSWLSPFLDPEVRRIDRINASDKDLLDAVMRCFYLSEALDGRIASNFEVLLARPVSAEKLDDRRGYQDTERHDRELRQIVGSVTRVYAWRAQFIAARGVMASTNGLAQTALRHLSENSRSINRHYESNVLRTKAAESLAVLASELELRSEILQFALSVRNGWSVFSATKADTLVSRLRNVTTLHGDLLTSMTNEAHLIRREKIGAGDKSSILAQFAKWILWFSPEDSKVLFDTALEVAAELDSEIIPQLQALGALVDRGLATASDPVSRRGLAQAFSDVLEDAGIRLENVDGFPWGSGMQTLAALDFSSALSCSARWQDMGLVSLHHTLDAVIGTGLKQGQLSVGQAASLMQLLNYVESETISAIVEAAKIQGSDNTKLAEFFAQNLILERIKLSGNAEAFAISKGTGPWAERLKDRDRFLRELPRDHSDGPSELVTARSEMKTGAFKSVWAKEDLTEPERLGQRIQQILFDAREEDRFISASEILADARSNVEVRDRVAHLDALIAVRDGLPDSGLISGMIAAVVEWKALPSVRHWCRTKLPEAISTFLPAFSRYYPHDDGRLSQAIELSEVPTERIISILLTGIERNVDAMSASSLFAIVSRMAASLPASDAYDTSSWYITRLYNRLSSEDKTLPERAKAPNTTTESLGRFFFALLGDVDIYLRWRAAHSLRCLADFNEASTFQAVWGEFDRFSDPAFRQPDAPYYWLSSRLWLLIASDRVALDHPSLIATLGSQLLLSIATDKELPHILLREYAADTCRKLVSASAITLSEDEAKALDSVNKSLLPHGNGSRKTYDIYNAFSQRDKDGLRFRFDTVDTLRYWYSDWIRIFDDVSQEKFLLTADKYITDVWGVIDEAPYGTREKRTGRFSERMWRRSSNSHGTLPTLERYQNHLEWHAMWCAAGELLETAPLAHQEWDDGLEYEIKINKLTAPPFWLADLVGDRPLLKSFWQAPDRPVAEWRKDAADSEILSEIIPADRPGYLVIGQSATTVSQHFRHEVRVTTGLVSLDTGHALVRALQTTYDNFDYRIPPEGDDLEIDVKGYQLRGWLKDNAGDRRFDCSDRFSNSVRRIECEPGLTIIEALELTCRFENGPRWLAANSSEPTFVYEAWGHPEAEDDREIYYDDSVRSDGYRLLVRISDLSKFLAIQRKELIMEVGLRRDEKGKRKSTYDGEDPTEVEFDRVLLFRLDGTIQAAERSVGAWGAAC